MKYIQNTNYLIKSIEDFKNVANEFKVKNKCGKFSVEVNVFKGGFAGYKIRQEEDIKTT